MALSFIKITSDSEIFFNAKTIEINGKRFQTPYALVHNSIPANELPKTTENKMYEVWKSFEIKKIAKVPENDQIATNFNATLDNAIKLNKSQPKLMFLALSHFTGNPIKSVSVNLQKYLIDSIHLRSEIITFPIIRGIIDLYTSNPSNLGDDYIKYIESCYEIAQTLNHKPIMVPIPRVTFNQVNKIVNKCLKLEMQMFSFDFEGHSLSAYYPNYREFLRTLYLHDKASFGEKIIHTLNLNLPSNRNRDYNYFPADDLLTPAMATDFLGQIHISKGGFKEVTKVKTKKETKREKKRINLVNINDYNYYRITSVEDFHKNFENAPISPNFEDFTATDQAKRDIFKRKFNYIQLNQEFSNMKNQVEQNSSILANLKTKNGISDEITPKVIGLKKEILTQKTLTSFFKLP